MVYSVASVLIFKLQYICWIAITSTIFVSKSYCLTEVTSCFQDNCQKDGHMWSVGIPAVNITFRNFTAGVKVLKVFNSTGTLVFTCSLSGGGTNCNADSGCSCDYIGVNAYETIYSLHLTDWTAQNSTLIRMETNAPPVTIVAQASLDFLYCDRYSNGLSPGVVAAPVQCDYGCIGALTCEDKYQSINVSSQCRENATWSETVDCIEKTTTSAPSTTIEYAEPTTTDASNGNSTDKSTEPTTTAPSNSESTDNSTGMTTTDDPGRNNGGNTGIHPGWTAAIVIVSAAVLGGAGYGGYLLYKKKKGGYIGGNAD